MILPTKHIPLERSLLAAGAAVLPLLGNPATPTALWERAKRVPEIGSYGRFVLTLDFLFAVGAIEMADGLIVRNDVR